ncbi:MAG TPA: ornithine cyclodeaminase family protein [Thermoleophilia bacterium]|nr:ornithine cyclodeaminase family protein [Thermoleophilia bacterium]
MTGSLLYLSREDLGSLGVSMGEVVDAVDAGCAAKGRGEVVMPPKLSLHGEGDAYSQVMAATLAGGGLGAKWVTLFPQNAARGLPITNGLVVLGDGETGLPSAVLDAATITAWRTGASVGVAARYLARRDVTTAGVLGCGVQARASVRALAAVLPGLREVRCHDAVPAVAASFAAELGADLPHLSLVVVPTPDAVVADAGVVVTAITMTRDVRPPLGAGLLAPGALAVALDYDAAWTAAAMAECDRLFCDDVAAALATRAAGARLAGLPDPIAGDLGDLAAGLVRGRERADERLFCLNLGMALEDVVTGELALRRARELGVGTELPL